MEKIFSITRGRLGFWELISEKMPLLLFKLHSNLSNVGLKFPGLQSLKDLKLQHSQDDWKNLTTINEKFGSMLHTIRRQSRRFPKILKKKRALIGSLEFYKTKTGKRCFR